MIEDIKKDFVVCKKTDTLYQISTQNNILLQTLYTLVEKGFITLTQLTCCDWIEEDIFSLNYILTNQSRDINLMVLVNIQREKSTLASAKDIFPQALVMERDIHEMFGIEFQGNNTLYDFALEDWEDIPPLRREFDTLKFVNENFEFKNGREDNKDVKAELKRRKELAKKKEESKDD